MMVIFFQTESYFLINRVQEMEYKPALLKITFLFSKQ